MDNTQLWTKFKNHLLFEPELGFALDISRMNFPEQFLTEKEGVTQAALAAMAKLDKGAIANPDENRMVGHYWLRAPELSPSPEIKKQIEITLAAVKSFAKDIHAKKITTPSGKAFANVLVIGIGGSALGPQFVGRALSTPRDPLRLFFFDNTDPDGMERTLREISALDETLCIVISKSGGTRETLNGQLIAKAAWREAGLDHGRFFVAVTGDDSQLEKIAISEKWLARFPMWDWIGGRTSEFSAVGLLPAALQGIDVDQMLAGAKSMDDLSRRTEVRSNPAALMALMWLSAGKGRGEKTMVVLPYKDRLELFSKYLQQLLMESLGKEKDLNGKVVNQGIAVYGNKGTTDQHAYVQQLRDGLNNFFAVFIEVLNDRCEKSQLGGTLRIAPYEMELEPQTTCGDYLSGFFQGTRAALYGSSRESMTITIDKLNEFSVGMLIALFERAVGIYAQLININAYHQPGVEAGKKAATDVIKLQTNIWEVLNTKAEALTCEQIAAAAGKAEQAETVFKILQHLRANDRIKVDQGGAVFSWRYSSK